MKLPIVTDSHHGARNDSVVFQEYFNRFYSELFFPYLKEHNLKTIVHAGDSWDRRKYVNFRTLYNTRRNVYGPMEQMGVKQVTLAGNHDTFHKNTSEVNSLTELFGHSKYIDVITEPTTLNFDGLDILMLPWINQENEEASLKAIEESTARVVIGHLEIAGFNFNRGIRCEHGLNKDLFKKFELVLSGHFHHKSDDGRIYYLGAPYEMTFADCNDPRGFHVLDTDTLELEYIQNPFKMFHRTYYDDRDKTLDDLTGKKSSKLKKYAGSYVKVIVTHKTNPYLFDQYLDKLNEVGPVDISVQETITYEDDDGNTIDGTEDTLTILNHCVDGLEVDLDKNKLKELTRSIYVEASTKESE